MGRYSIWGWVGLLWGVGGVVLFLMMAVIRLLPVALEALRMELGPVEWGGLVLSVASLGYYEGYRAFQKAFSPRTVARARYIAEHPRPHFVLFAPAMAMGLFFATPKRLLVSWGVLLGVTGLVLVVRTLEQPWRGIVDAGVVVGLSWGTVSMILYWVLTIRDGRPMPVPPDVPN